MSEEWLGSEEKLFATNETSADNKADLFLFLFIFTQNILLPLRLRLSARPVAFCYWHFLEEVETSCIITVKQLMLRLCRNSSRVWSCWHFCKDHCLCRNICRPGFIETIWKRQNFARHFRSPKLNISAYTVPCSFFCLVRLCGMRVAEISILCQYNGGERSFIWSSQHWKNTF